MAVLADPDPRARHQQAYISGHALVILGGPQTLLQTIYVDDTDKLEAVAFEEASGRIAVCGGPDVFVYHPYGLPGETLKVRMFGFPLPGDPPMIYQVAREKKEHIN